MRVALVFLMLVASSPAQAQLAPPLVRVWGSRGTGPGEFDAPWGIALGPDGSVYVVDQNNYRVQKFTRDGAFLLQWGGVGRGAGQFGWPYAIAVDQESFVYVTDMYAGSVQKFTSDGVFVLQWGRTGTGCGEFDRPGGVAVAPDGHIFVQDARRMQVFTSDGRFVSGWNQCSDMEGIVQLFTITASGIVYRPWFLNVVEKCSLSGELLRSWGSTGQGIGQFGGPADVAVDRHGFVYITENGNNRVQKFTSDGVFVTMWGHLGQEKGAFDQPAGIATGDGETIYVVDCANNRIQVFGDLATAAVSSTWGKLKSRYRQPAAGGSR